MRDVALMLPLKVLGDIRSIEKSPCLSALPDARKANLLLRQINI